MSADLFTPLPCLACGTPTAPHLEHTAFQCYATKKLAEKRANMSPEDKARIVRTHVREVREMVEHKMTTALSQACASQRDADRGLIPQDWADQDYITWMRWSTMLDALAK